MVVGFGDATFQMLLQPWRFPPFSSNQSVPAFEATVDGIYLDVDLHVEGLRLTLTVTDVEADHVLRRSLTFGLSVLNIEDAVRRQVVHREGRVRGDHLRTANRAP